MSECLWLYCALSVAVLACGVLRFEGKEKRRIRRLRAKRIGINPGAFGLRTLAAKRNFYEHGYRIVRAACQSVCPFAYRCQLVRILTKPSCKSRDSNYVVQTQDIESLTLAPKLLSEVQALPEGILSHRASIADRYVGVYTGLDIVLQSNLHADVCRVQLTQQQSIESS